MRRGSVKWQTKIERRGISCVVSKGVEDKSLYYLILFPFARTVLTEKKKKEEVIVMLLR